jgi:hypothetical protein
MLFKSKLKISVLLMLSASFVGVANTIPDLPSSYSSGGANKFRFPTTGGNESERATKYTWVQLYKDRGLKSGLIYDSELAGESVELGSLGLQLSDLPDYTYPAATVGNVDISNNNFGNLSFFQPNMMVEGSLNAANTGMTDVSSLSSLAGVAGNVMLFDNPSVADISQLGFLPINIGGSLVLDAPAQYTRLMGNATPVCLQAESGDLSIVSNVSYVPYTAYCEPQREWVDYYQSYGQYTDLVADAELYDKYVDFYLKSKTGLPSSNYPVPKISGLRTGAADITNLDFLNTVQEITGQINLTSIHLQDMSGLRNVRKIGSKLHIDTRNTGITSITGMDSLKSVGIISLYLYRNYGTNQVVLKDVSGLENIEEVSEVWMGYKQSYDKLPSADAPLCKYIAANRIKVKMDSGTDYAANRFCDSGSQWQEVMEDMYASPYQDYVMTQAEGIDIGPLNIYSIRSTFADADIPSEVYPNTAPTYISVSWAEVTHIDFMAPIESTDYINIGNNFNLTNVNGLSGIVANRVSINSNPKLTDLSGIAGMTINGRLSLVDNPLVKDYRFLENFTSNITEATFIDWSVPREMLPTGEGDFCKAIGNKVIKLDRSLYPRYYCNSGEYFNFLHSWAGLSGFVVSKEQLSQVSLSLSPSVRDYMFPNEPFPVKSIHSIVISGNSNLTNLDFLDGLETMNEYFTIADNNDLTDISGLENMTFSESGMGRLTIWGAVGGDISALSNLVGVKVLRLDNPSRYTTLLDINGTTCQGQIAGNTVFINVNSYSQIRPTSYYCR